MKILVIVESPSKVKKIEKILNDQKDGNNYVVSASVGHILCLATENTYGKTLGIDVDNDYKPDYVEDPNKYNVISGLRRLAKTCQQVWIASDLDFEGEFIGYSLCKVLGISEVKTPRLIFNEISKKAILNAAKNPTYLNFNLIDARSCRRVTDRLIGFKISTVARVINPKLRVGRVQTMMIKLVNDREKEMESFTKSFQYHTQASFIPQNDQSQSIISTKLSKTFTEHEKVKTFLETCIQPQTQYIIQKKQVKTVIGNPSSPLITSTLQSLVSSRLGITPKQVLEVAQSLYQKGVTSYPRTDCPKLPEDKMDDCQTFILENYGEDYHRRKEYSNSKDDSAQEAHACIYPINLKVTDLSEMELNDDGEGDEDGTIQRYTNWEKRVYRLIWLYTMASQMAPSETERTTVFIGFEKPKSQSEIFQASYDKLVFEGYLKVWGKTAHLVDVDDNASDNSILEDSNLDSSDPNAILLSMKEGDPVFLKSIESKQKAVQGPTPYTESGMMSRLKKYGIGRPSCAGSILEKIINEGLVYRGNKAGEKAKINILSYTNTKTNKSSRVAQPELIEKTQDIKLNAYRRRLFSTELGREVDNFVTQYFPEIFNYEFTKNLEHSMDQIEKGEAVWYEVVDLLYKSFMPKIKEFYQNRRDNMDPEEQAKYKDKWERPEKRELGTYESEKVYTYLGRYGPVLQVGEDDDKNKKHIKLPDQFKIQSVELENIEHLLQFPKTLGKIGRKNLVLHNGQNGPYMKLGADKKGYNLKAEMFDPYDESVDFIQQIDNLKMPLIEKSITQSQEGKKVIRKVKDIEILTGQYGPYFRFQNKNISIPKWQNPEIITYDALMELYQFKVSGKKKTGGSKIQLKSTSSTQAPKAKAKAKITPKPKAGPKKSISVKPKAK